METRLLQKLVDKSMTKEELLQKVKQDFDILPDILDGVSSSKAAIRYGCAKVLMDLSEEYSFNHFISVWCVCLKLLMQLEITYYHY